MSSCLASSTLCLEDSWVLAVQEGVDELRLDVEGVLTEDHPEWHPPKTDEVHAYERLSLVFPNPRSVTWVERMTGPPAVDASGEADYGHIDVFTPDGSVFELQGDWGHVRVVGDPPIVTDLAEPAH